MFSLNYNICNRYFKMFVSNKTKNKERYGKVKYSLAICLVSCVSLQYDQWSHPNKKQIAYDTFPLSHQEWLGFYLFSKYETHNSQLNVCFPKLSPQYFLLLPKVNGKSMAFFSTLHFLSPPCELPLFWRELITKQFISILYFSQFSWCNPL